MRLSTTKPHRLTEFLSIHHLGVKALAMHDEEMLRLVERWWPMETNVGRMTLAEFRERYGVVRYSASTDQFRQLAAVAAAQDIALINAGYTYDTELIERLAQVDPSIVVERLDPSDLATRFEPLDPASICGRGRSSRRRNVPWTGSGARSTLRSFEPAGLSAMYLIDRDAAFQSELRATKDKADALWADVLSAIEATAVEARPQLVLNYRNPLVRG